MFEELGGVDLQIRPGELAALGDTEAAYARVLQALQQRELVFTAQDTTESLRRWVRVYRATVGGHDRYRSEQAVQCPIHLLRASEQPQTAPEPTGLMSRSDWGWSDLTQAGVRVQFVPGTHITMMTSPHVRTLAEAMNRALLFLN